MKKDNPPAPAFSTPVAAKDGMQTFCTSGCDVKKVSLIDKGYHSEEAVEASKTFVGSGNLSNIDSRFDADFKRIFLSP